jgi:hypothetical protein|tara:strand:- start:747 stop:923 length:177 start_codon:yes stop_codon:yes gene_type:complete
MSIKRYIAVVLWAVIGLAINTQFDPNTVIGSVMGSAFIFIWIGVLVIGIFTWIKLNKK